VHKSLLVQLLAALVLCACVPALTPRPSSFPTETPTATALPTQTNTPEPTPTFQFYASDIRISATAESCVVPPAKRCLSGLNVKLTGRVLSEYTVTVISDGIPDTTFDCPEKFALEGFGQYSIPVDCDSTGITLVSLGLTEITLVITWQDGSTTQTFAPVYEAYAINGPKCDPVCTVATIEMKIP
jgi:hypothetical protein